MSDHPREVQWYLCKYIPDLERNEPRNVGLIVRPADGPMTWRFMTIGEFGNVGRPTTAPAKELAAGRMEAYREQIGKWTGILEKHGEKCLRWITKRSKKTPRFYIELAGGRIVAGRIDMDAFFERLVL